jgi:hypothetical protein
LGHHAKGTYMLNKEYKGKYWRKVAALSVCYTGTHGKIQTWSSLSQQGTKDPSICTCLTGEDYPK